MDKPTPAARLIDPHSPAAAKVGERIAVLRREARLSRPMLADCADLDVRHLQRIERGHGNPTLLSLMQIAVALEVPLSRLVEGLEPEDMPQTRRPYGHSARDRQTRRRYFAGNGALDYKR
ncbi:helix-turn-helix domain-containing protein [Microbacterium marinilacus]|uniref:HTH cro/C1-type domain-containing protein n=1 Tax=Microbacterium marinilacus TaxID=415209 RepID=A0ABP7B4E0_9MICO|nr:helix-turn-helix transcriptional regulator [Microbacterium marinilacus]MBY0687844.1 helix-turn-helix domain-containing protein [Microbacterium marinilacus]